MAILRQHSWWSTHQQFYEDLTKRVAFARFRYHTSPGVQRIRVPQRPSDLHCGHLVLVMVVGHACQAKISDFSRAITAEEDVLALDVAVKDLRSVLM